MTAAGQSVVHLMPAPLTAAISLYDFSQTSRLIDEAAALTRAWLANNDSDRDLAAARESVGTRREQRRPPRGGWRLMRPDPCVRARGSGVAVGEGEGEADSSPEPG